MNLFIFSSFVLVTPLKNCKPLPREHDILLSLLESFISDRSIETPYLRTLLYFFPVSHGSTRKAGSNRFGSTDFLIHS